ncbi:Peroxisome proliferation transcriptional regulator [Talaromyces islandicus]|uniref:Peroxisome proliferation transcriptional regulator n=1 Tax=Talaromyces islandicus TaxID=28573 RepID=A0A0U1LX25_TALIS|nr:Peroxisome proliferation transcriptional regulator [Talaromyces islandicus]
MQQSGPRTRRNGTLQSCEPCRKSKLKCDHVIPVCGRCMAKDIAHKCFYHPSPMTKKGIGSGIGIGIGSGSVPFAADSQQSSTPPPPYVSPAETTSWVPSGYLGTSNFFSILQDCGTEVPTAFETHNIAIPRNLQPDPVPVGAEVLRILYQFPVCDVLIARYQANVLVFAMPDTIVNAIIGSVRQTLEHFDELGGLLTPQLARFAHMIFQNSSRPMTVNRSMTVEQYCASFTGPNFRWEALGNYFAVAGMALVGTPDNDPVLLAANIHKETLLSLLIEASDICIKFCEHPSSVNELLVYLLNNDSKLKTHRYGDIDYLCWRQMGVIWATITTAGLHQESGPEEDCPFFLSQWRKMCFVANYNCDKNLATFMGRPPLIPRRYCNVVAPLDISEEVLVAGSEAVAQAAAQLDPLGWNPNSIHRISFLRLRYFVALLREEVLEIVLGCKQGGTMPIDAVGFENKVNHVLEKAKASWDATPSHLRFDHQDGGIAETAAHPWVSRYQLIMPYLEHLYSFFLLRRALLQQTGSGHAEFFDTAREVLSTVNYLSGNKELMVDRSRHYAWLMLSYGVASASVLALQLLHQNQGSTAYVLPGRTDLIRKLTVFTSSLSWVTRPDHGDYALCIEAEKRLTAMLDEILDPTPRPAEIAGLDGASSTNFGEVFAGYDFVGMPLPEDGFFAENTPWP